MVGARAGSTRAGRSRYAPSVPHPDERSRLRRPVSRRAPGRSGQGTRPPSGPSEPIPGAHRTTPPTTEEPLTEIQKLKPRPDLGSGADAFATQSEAAHAMIREDILSGRFEPGRKLLLDHLRTQYGFGSSPLREALSRLAADRLVTAKGQKGYWVAAISEDEFTDITDMRLFLEPEALERSIERATLDWESGVVAAFHRLTRVEGTLDKAPEELSGEWERENRAFHLALIENCGSPWLLRFVLVLSEQSERYRRQAVARLAVPKETLLAEHKAIFDAAIARNAGLASELLKVHIKNSARSLARSLFPASAGD
nr:FCD domain-containing protein [Amorphus coralli]